MANNRINFVNPISVAVGGVASAQSIPELEQIINSNGLVLTIAAVISIVVFLTIQFVFGRLPKKFFWSRKLLDLRAKYEGHYLEVKNVDGNRVYAIVCLSYNYPINEYQLSGVSIEKDGSMNIQWKSHFVQIDTHDKMIVYAQRGELTDTSDSKIFDGVTYMNFDQASNGRPDRGFGHYMDSLPAKSSFQFLRINKDHCRKYLKKDNIENHDDYQKFVIGYHNEFPEAIFSWEPKQQ